MAVRKSAWSAIKEVYQRFAFREDIYCRLGLLEHDVLNEDPVVVRAIRRLTPAEYNQRVWRIMRAHDLMLKHDFLPEKDWTKFGDPKHKYLQRHIEEVAKELQEIDSWNENIRARQYDKTPVFKMPLDWK